MACWCTWSVLAPPPPAWSAWVDAHQGPAGVGWLDIVHFGAAGALLAIAAPEDSEVSAHDVAGAAAAAAAANHGHADATVHAVARGGFAEGGHGPTAADPVGGDRRSASAADLAAKADGAAGAIAPDDASLPLAASYAAADAAADAAGAVAISILSSWFRQRSVVNFVLIFAASSASRETASTESGGNVWAERALRSP
eukprot:TRINITY_DN5966_c1_g1_i2.p2 TRINITY_DN5966_c1_g1~~TRINITY_DN5966_c1_g1_i2.p2  ORF type:complete len:198 (-),score=49.33 TRINITY_DN5966_c1_g1_i2:601-1194(-)